MMNIIGYFKDREYENGTYLEKHHIVPKIWFKYNSIEVDEDQSNIVFLPPEYHLKVHLLLFYYFKNNSCIEICKK